MLEPVQHNICITFTLSAQNDDMILHPNDYEVPITSWLRRAEEAGDFDHPQLVDDWEICPDHIIMERFIGEGNFGEVYRGTLVHQRTAEGEGEGETQSQQPRTVAIKVLRCEIQYSAKYTHTHTHTCSTCIFYVHLVTQPVVDIVSGHSCRMMQHPTPT